MLTITSPTNATTSIFAVNETISVDPTLIPEIVSIAGNSGPELWIGTTNGLVEFDTISETAIVAPGMESFTGGAALLTFDSSGYLWFGSSTGIVAYNPTTNSYMEAAVVLDAAEISQRPSGGVYITDRTSRMIYRASTDGSSISINIVAGPLPSNLKPEHLAVDAAGTGLWVTTQSSTDANRLIHINASGTTDIQCDFTTLIDGITVHDLDFSMSNIARVGNWLHFGSPASGLVWSLNETAALTSCDRDSLKHVSGVTTIYRMFALPNGTLFASGGGGYYQTFGQPSGAITSVTSLSTEPFSYTIGAAHDVVIDSSGWLWFGFTNNFKLYKLETGLAPLYQSGLSLSGTMQVGQTLTASHGTWDYMGEAGATYSYSWKRCTQGTCTAIDSASNSTYTLQEADRGYSIQVNVTATNRNGTSSPSSYESSSVVRWALRSVPLAERIVNIYDVISDSQNNIWISDAKLLTFDPSTEINSIAPGMESLNSTIGDLEVDTDGNIWFDDQIGGIGVYTPNSDSYVTDNTLTAIPNGMSPRASGGIYIGDSTSQTLYSAVLTNGQIVISPIVTFTGAVEPATAIEDAAGTGLWVTITSPSTSDRLVHISLPSTTTITCNLSDIDPRVAQGSFGTPTNLVRNGDWIYFGTKAAQQVWAFNETELTSTCTSSNLHFVDSGAQLYSLKFLEDGSLLGTSDGTRFVEFGKPSGQIQPSEIHILQIDGEYDSQAGWSNSVAIGPTGSLWFGFTWGLHGTNNVYEVESGLTPVLRDGATVSGNLVQGQVLTGGHGTWKYADSGSSLEYNYQWQRCASTSCTDLAAATSPTYTIQSGDVGSSIRLKVTAENRNGTSSAAYSSTSAAVISVPSTPRSASLKVAGNKSLKITWSAPSTTHGSAIDKYKIVFNGHTYYTSSRSYTFTGLKPWQKYNAKIYAHNAAGYSSVLTSSYVYPQYWVKKKSKTSLTAIITPAKTSGAKWTESGSCSIKKSKLVAAKKATNCTLKVKNGSTTRTAVVKVS